jgi:hypothetical protein
LNKIVSRCLAAAGAAVLAGVPPAEAETPRSAVQNARPAPKAAKPPAAPSQGATSAYTSAERGCGVVRRRLWTEAGWIVRRVAACR